MKNCRFSRKTIAYEIVELCDFTPEYKTNSMRIVNSFIRGCAYKCPDKKCLAYHNIMMELAEKYKLQNKSEVNSDDRS